MISKIKEMLGMGPKVNYAELVKLGAIILDVRSKGEFNGGHIKGSINISVDQLGNNLSKLKDKSKPIITCCASGMRSSAAASALTKAGIEAYNGGPWSSLQQAIR